MANDKETTDMTLQDIIGDTIAVRKMIEEELKKAVYDGREFYDGEYIKSVKEIVQLIKKFPNVLISKLYGTTYYDLSAVPNVVYKDG